MLGLQNWVEDIVVEMITLFFMILYYMMNVIKWPKTKVISEERIPI